MAKQKVTSNGHVEPKVRRLLMKNHNVKIYQDLINSFIIHNFAPYMTFILFISEAKIYQRETKIDQEER